MVMPTRTDDPSDGRTGRATTLGCVDLIFARVGSRTVLRRHHSVAPLHVQGLLAKSAAENDCAEVVILNVAGGVVGGDTLDQRITAEPGAAVRVLTAGATRLYRVAGPVPARATTVLRVAAGARLEYLPDEIIPYAGALYESRMELELEPGAHAIVTEVVGPGRLHRGELFAYRRLTLRVRADQAGVPLLRDTLTLDPAQWGSGRNLVFGPYTHSATLYAFGIAVPAAAIVAAELHALMEAAGVHGGVTCGIPGVIVLRAAGSSAYTLLQMVRAAANRCRRHMSGE